MIELSEYMQYNVFSIVQVGAVMLSVVIANVGANLFHYKRKGGPDTSKDQTTKQYFDIWSINLSAASFKLDWMG